MDIFADSDIVTSIMKSFKVEEKNNEDGEDYARYFLLDRNKA